MKKLFLKNCCIKLYPWRAHLLPVAERSASVKMRLYLHSASLICLSLYTSIHFLIKILRVTISWFYIQRVRNLIKFQINACTKSLQYFIQTSKSELILKTCPRLQLHKWPFTLLGCCIMQSSHALDASGILIYMVCSSLINVGKVINKLISPI